MPLFNFDLEDGQPKVSFSLAGRDADRFMAFMSDCTNQIASAERMRAHLESMQRDATAYLIPDNRCSVDWFVNRMLHQLDGPEQRAAMRKAP